VLKDRLLLLGSTLSRMLFDGATEHALLNTACGALKAVGVPVARAMIGVDTLHPVVEGRLSRWRRDSPEAEFIELEFSAFNASSEVWLRSPFYYLLNTREPRLHCRLDTGRPHPFPALDDLAREGLTDYVAYAIGLEGDAVIGEIDSVYASWSTDHPEGFTDDHVAAIDYTVTALASAILAISNRRIAATLVDTYLGRDAGRRVLAGSIRRGRAERISAVLWFSDLRGFSRLVDTLDPELVLPLLNDYADAVVSAVHGHGGQVLKFMGDGTLAVFPDTEGAAGHGAAIAAVDDALAAVADLNARRRDQGLPITELYLGLHVGEVHYGNIGAVDRLDFTVIGPAVNEVSRIADMCRSLDQDVVVSTAFARGCGDAACRLVSLGRYALRGIKGAQELYTIER
jgi:adenylate cyclase